MGTSHSKVGGGRGSKAADHSPPFLLSPFSPFIDIIFTSSQYFGVSLGKVLFLKFMDNHCPRVGIPVIQGQQCRIIHQNKLVKGMTDIIVP